MQIKRVQDSDIDRALKLIWETFLEFEAPDYSEDGVQSFHEFIEDRAVVDSLLFFGAYDKEELKGVIALNSECTHICCFFVRARYHRQGIGRTLWEYVLAHSKNDMITVNSSPYAVPVYHKLGFTDTDSEQLVDGIRYMPMKYERG
jgi:GNAT superfamily N-acetyltransferase